MQQTVLYIAYYTTKNVVDGELYKRWCMCTFFRTGDNQFIEGLIADKWKSLKIEPESYTLTD